MHLFFHYLTVYGLTYIHSCPLLFLLICYYQSNTKVTSVTIQYFSILHILSWTADIFSVITGHTYDNGSCFALQADRNYF